MTDRPTNEEQKAQAETPTMPDFSRYMVCDSYAIPATDTTTVGGAPEPHRRLSRQQLISGVVILVESRKPYRISRKA